MTRKTYTGKALGVSFDLDTCIHAGECVRGLPAVFDTQRRPWILPDGAEADAVREVVARCPSGALEIVESPSEPASAAAVEVRAGASGPYVLSGPVRVLGPDGEVLREAARVALCRCTRSATQPFCDGSHAR